MTTTKDNTIKKPKAKVKAKKTTRLPRWAKITLKILRYLLVPILCVIAVISGMIIGYVTVGKQEFSEVFQIDTWRHLYDLVFKDNVGS